jgi:hypothetical protein
MQLFSAVFDTPIGKLHIEFQTNTLQRITFLASTPTQQSTEPFYQQIQNELTAYFQNPHHQFTLPVLPQGTSNKKSGKHSQKFR